MAVDGDHRSKVVAAAIVIVELPVDFQIFAEASTSLKV